MVNSVELFKLEFVKSSNSISWLKKSMIGVYKKMLIIQIGFEYYWKKAVLIIMHCTKDKEVAFSKTPFRTHNSTLLFINTVNNIAQDLLSAMCYVQNHLSIHY